MFLITSGAYITSDLASEFGKIPPAFLPLQNKRLIFHQLNLIKNEKVVLSIPENFKIPSFDNVELSNLKIEVIFVPEGISLGESIDYVLERCKIENDYLKILHGDTLFDSLPNELDIYSTSTTSDNYTWTESDEEENEKKVYSGYFAFSSLKSFKQSLKYSKGDFIQAILEYKKKHSVKNYFISEWKDFGHANTYYRSKMKFTTERAFNDLVINEVSVKKYSSVTSKILAEANWFLQIPSGLRRYSPAFFDSGTEGDRAFYEIEYFYLSSLAELFVFGKNEVFIWDKIFSACDNFLTECNKNKYTKPMELESLSERLYKEKTMQRLQTYSVNANINLDEAWTFNGVKAPSLREIIKETSDAISKPNNSFLSVIHGDFGFSNILYDFKTQTIKVIDPRGIDIDGNESIFGDIRYDIAKLAHSVIGMYDFIIAGYYNYKENKDYNIEFNIPIDEVTKNIQTRFLKRTFAGITLEESDTFPILVHLFLSMIPLHSDKPERQKAMMANAMRLYIDYKMEKKL